MIVKGYAKPIEPMPPRQCQSKFRLRFLTDEGEEMEYYEVLCGLKNGHEYHHVFNPESTYWSAISWVDKW